VRVDEDGNVCTAVREYRSDAAYLCDTTQPCLHQVVYWLLEADAVGDGPLVNALCWYGRARWGENLYW
jgi:hypothetical protein